MLPYSRDYSVWNRAPKMMIDRDQPPLIESYRGGPIASPTPFLQALGIMILYGVCAVCTSVFDKILFVRFHFDYTVIILLVQSVLLLIILECLRITKTANIARFSMERCREMMLPSVCYCMYSVFALHVAIGVNFPMYGTFKRCAPLLNLYLATTVLKKGYPNRAVVLSCVLITFGAIITSITDKTDYSFDAWAYFYGILSIICHVLYLTFLEQLNSFQKFSTFDMLYLNSINSTFLLIILDVFDEEILESLSFFQSAYDYITVFFGLAVGFGAAMTFFQFVCTTATSSLTTSVAGSCKSTIGALIGYLVAFPYLMDGEIDAFNFLGILMNWSGGLLFLYNKWMEKQSFVKTSW